MLGDTRTFKHKQIVAGRKQTVAVSSGAEHGSPATLDLDFCMHKEAQ